MKITIEERIPETREGLTGTDSRHIADYKNLRSAIKRAKKESRKTDNEVDIRAHDDDWELTNHMIFSNGKCVHSISQ